MFDREIARLIENTQQTLDRIDALSEELEITKKPLVCEECGNTKFHVIYQTKRKGPFIERLKKCTKCGAKFLFREYKHSLVEKGKQ